MCPSGDLTGGGGREHEGVCVCVRVCVLLLLTVERESMVYAERGKSQKPRLPRMLSDINNYAAKCVCCGGIVLPKTVLVKLEEVA